MVRHVSPDVPTVLLVDSHEDDRTTYADYLRVYGLNPVEIGNTADALRSARNADVIVTGIHVAGSFDGVELVRRLRDSHDMHDKPIIVLTACAFESDRQRALAAGCDAFLPKPCLPDKLVREILAILGRHHSAEDAISANTTIVAVATAQNHNDTTKGKRIMETSHRRNETVSLPTAKPDAPTNRLAGDADVTRHAPELAAACPEASSVSIRVHAVAQAVDPGVSNME